MRKITRKTTFRFSHGRRNTPLLSLFFDNRLYSAKVTKLGKRLVKRKKHLGVTTALNNVISSVRQYIDTHMNFSLKITYANTRPIDSTTIQTMEKTLLFVIMQMANFVQKDSGMVISVRYEKQFINIRIQNCRLKNGIRRSNRLIKIISRIQHWIKTQNGYSDYIIDKHRICNFNIYLLQR